MDFSAAVNRVLVPGREANSLRWIGERGRYEVYYLTLNHLPSRLGLWLRYTLDAPNEGGGVCELWGHAFDGQAPEQSFGLKERLPIARLERPPGAILRIGEAALTPTRASGELKAGGRALRWDLEFLPAERAVYMAPYPLRSLGLTSTTMLIAQPDARFRGRVLIGDRELMLDGAPGTLAHLWGTKHTERWVWAHCNAFQGRDDCALDAVAVWVRRLGGLRGPLTSVFLRYRGRDFCLNALPAARSSPNGPSPATAPAFGSSGPSGPRLRECSRSRTRTRTARRATAPTPRSPISRWRSGEGGSARTSWWPKGPPTWSSATELPSQESAPRCSGWVHEACRGTGAACESGDQCCSGFCRAPSEGAGAVCVEKPQGCAHEFESCQVQADCCQSEGLTCYGQRCTVATGPN